MINPYYSKGTDLAGPGGLQPPPGSGQDDLLDKRPGRLDRDQDGLRHDSNDLEFGERLRSQGREARGHAALLVPGRDEHAHQARFPGGRGFARPGKARPPAENHPDAPEAPQGGNEQDRGGKQERRGHARGYRPTNRGRRFSRNAAVPSL